MRCKIEEGVLDFFREKAKDLLLGGWQLDNIDRLRLAQIAKGVTGIGKGMDLLKTQIIKLPFESIVVRRGWLIAYTVSPFYMDEVENTWDFGYRPAREYINVTKNKWITSRYAVCIPDDLRNLDRVHFVPEVDPFVSDRHPHHLAFPPPGENRRTVGPLTWETSTCWSEFASPLRKTMDNLDFAMMLSIFHQFTKTYYPQSPKATARDIHFMELA